MRRWCAAWETRGRRGADKGFDRLRIKVRRGGGAERSGQGPRAYLSDLHFLHELGESRPVRVDLRALLRQRRELLVEQRDAAGEVRAPLLEGEEEAVLQGLHVRGR